MNRALILTIADASIPEINMTHGDSIMVHFNIKQYRTNFRQGIQQLELDIKQKFIFRMMLAKQHTQMTFLCFQRELSNDYKYIHTNI